MYFGGRKQSIHMKNIALFLSGNLFTYNLSLYGFRNGFERFIMQECMIKTIQVCVRDKRKTLGGSAV